MRDLDKPEPFKLIRCLLRMTPCAGCARWIWPDPGYSCWWCVDDLCKRCWEEVGHCGHPEAEAANERARQVVQP